ncbi:hypothetical protein KOF112_11500 [Bacillus velezensis]|nr:hypothetical protein KOF112_11500 [Bacillus velezensis]
MTTTIFLLKKAIKAAIGMVSRLKVVEVKDVAINLNKSLAETSSRKKKNKVDK